MNEEHTSVTNRTSSSDSGLANEWAMEDKGAVKNFDSETTESFDDVKVCERLWWEMVYSVPSVNQSRKLQNCEDITSEKLNGILPNSTGGVAFAEKGHFGMTLKEFHSAGKRVIVSDEPNLNNHITDGMDGLLIPSTKEGVQVGMQQIHYGKCAPVEIASSVEEWSLLRDEIRSIV